MFGRKKERVDHYHHVRGGGNGMNQRPLTEEEQNDQFLLFIVGAIMVIGALAAGLDWLDGTFGWHLKETIMGWLNSI